MTLSEENYLKAIYHLGKQGTQVVGTNTIAKKIETKASSVTDMIKKLANKNLANYIKYQGVSLTDEGRLAAALVVRKHRLWEVFLVDKLHFSWDEVHNIAEQLEHVKSLKLVNQLDAFLGYPTQDPHGDPIPDKDGNYLPNKSVNIFDIEVGKEGVLSFVKNASDTFLKYLNKNKLALGDKIKVLACEPYDRSVTIETKRGKIVISKEVAQNLYLNL